METDLIKQKNTENNISARITFLSPVSLHVAQLFFTVCDLSSIEPVYQYSLKFYQDIFGRAIELVPKDPNEKERIELLDYLLTFLDTDQELNYVLVGYFFKFMHSLICKRPLSLITYLFTTQRKALEKMIYHSYRKSMTELLLYIIGYEKHFCYSHHDYKDQDETNFDSDKKGAAKAFASAYNCNSKGFIDFFMKDSDSSIGMTYEESWDNVTQDGNSIKRGTNINILIDRILNGYFPEP